MTLLHMHALHKDTSVEVICQLVQTHTFVEYRHSSTRMIHFITRYLGVRSQSNHHVITAHTYYTYHGMGSWNLSTPSGMGLCWISSMHNKNAPNYSDISGRQIPVKSSCYHCTHVLHISRYLHMEMLNSFKPVLSQSINTRKSKWYKA